MYAEPPRTRIRFPVLCLALVIIAGPLVAEPTSTLEIALDDAAAPAFEGRTADGLWMMHREILGGEREEAAVDGGRTITWDGVDNDPGSLDASGLGGVDLTVGGVADRLLIDWQRSPESARVQVEVWSHEHRRSVASVQVAGDAGVQIPLESLRGTADLRQAGALRLTILSPTGAPAIERLALGLRHELPAPERSASRGPAIVPATLILAEGDMPPGGGGNLVTSLNAPFTNGSGDVGFTGNLDNGGSSDGFVFIGAVVEHLNSSVPGVTLIGGESTMGIDDGGGFFFSPSIDGDDGVWSQHGQVAVENTQAPGFPSGTNSTFHSRPTMIPLGDAYWISGFNESGGTSSEGRMLYTSMGATAGATTLVLRSDDMVNGTPIDRPSGVDFDYDLSDDGNHHIHVLLLDTGSTSDDGVVWVDGSVIAQETGATGDGDNWDNFDSVGINSSGDFLFSGDTDGATGSDEFIAYNGAIALREGDLVDGVTLGGSVLFLSIADDGRAVFAWSDEHLFHACDASDLAGTSTLLLSTGDSVDLDGNGTGDATVTDFNTSTTIGPTAPFSSGKVFVEVDLDQGAGDFEAILELAAPGCGAIFTDGFESGDTSAWTSTVP